ncbi:MAG: winged helix-turn-helix transcriptional regulator [Rhodospirillales bacterium]|nr:winged helix-turn-helix transcriptional regulator [Rhodospirillales bacterium]
MNREPGSSVAVTKAKAQRPSDAAVRTPGSAASAFDLDRFLPYRLSVLSEAVSRRLAHDYADKFNLTAMEWRVMAVLTCYQPLSANGICARTNMDKVQVTRAVSRLLRAALVARAEDPKDRRYISLSLTAKGRRICERIIPLARAREAEMLGVLDDAERRALDAILVKLMDKVCGGAPGRNGRNGVAKRGD